MKSMPSPAPYRHSRHALLSVLTALALSAGSTSALAGVQGPAPLPRPGDPAPETEWTNHGLDLAETRFSPLDQIDSDNVDRLGVAWSWQIPEDRSATRGHAAGLGRRDVRDRADELRLRAGRADR